MRNEQEVLFTEGREGRHVISILYHIERCLILRYIYPCGYTWPTMEVDVHISYIHTPETRL